MARIAIIASVTFLVGPGVGYLAGSRPAAGPPAAVEEALADPLNRRGK